MESRLTLLDPPMVSFVEIPVDSVTRTEFYWILVAALWDDMLSQTTIKFEINKAHFPYIIINQN